MGDVEVQLLGPVHVTIDGAPVHIGSVRQRAVIAALALNAGRVVSVDTLTELLWEDLPPPGARGTLQSFVSKLRSRVGDGVVISEHRGYRLAIDVEGTDVGRVHRLADEARRVRDNDPAHAAALYRAAVDAWRGPPLVDLGDHLGFHPDTVRLQELRRGLVDDLHEAEIDAGDAHGALPALEAIAASEPLRERSHLLLMRALHHTGRSAEALRAGQRFRSRLVEETGVDPSAALDELERRILTGDLPPPSADGAVATPATPLADADTERTPPQDTTTRRTPGRTLPRYGGFFGRSNDLDVLQRCVREDQLVTVIGPGGVGKTRLVAELLAGAPDAHAVVVELAGVAPGEVATTVAAAVGIGPEAASLDDALIDGLQGEPRTLVLDNCEHVIGEVRDLLARVSSDCPAVQVIATSRIRTGLDAERIVPLSPLPAGDGGTSPGVQLIADRVARADPAHQLDPRAAAELSERLDHLPLALELAASRIPALGVKALLSRIDESLYLLEKPTRPSDQRHRTLRALVDWSYQLLDDGTRALLCALSIAHDGFDLAGADAIAAAIGREDAPQCVAQLVEASMLVVHDGGGGHRYRMLETVRQYLAEHLDGDLRPARAAHARWVADVVDAIRERASGPDEHLAVAELHRERGNIRDAVRWAVANDPAIAGRLATGLAATLLYRPDVEMLTWLADAAESRAATTGTAGAQLVGAGARAAYLRGDLAAVDRLGGLADSAATSATPNHLAWHALGVANLYRGRFDEAEQWWQRTLEAPDAPATDRLDALGGVALARCYAGNLEAAASAEAEHAALAELVDSNTYRAFNRYVAGEVAVAAGSAERAVTLFDDAAHLAGVSGAQFIVGLANTSSVAALGRLGRHSDALARCHALLVLWRRTATWTQQWTTLRLLGELLVALDDHGTALLLFEAADRDHAAPAVVGGDAKRLADQRARCAAALSAYQFRQSTRLAAALGRDQVVDRALAITDRSST